MTHFKFLLFTAALALATAFTLSCSDGGGGSSNGVVGSEPIKKAKISGVFQKGPFVQGSTATLNELDNDLNPTGKPYQTLITDDKDNINVNILTHLEYYRVLDLVDNGMTVKHTNLYIPHYD